MVVFFCCIFLLSFVTIFCFFAVKKGPIFPLSYIYDEKKAKSVQILTFQMHFFHFAFLSPLHILDAKNTKKYYPHIKFFCTFLLIPMFPVVYVCFFFQQSVIEKRSSIYILKPKKSEILHAM